MRIKKLIINSGTIACLLFRKLSISTTTTFIIGRLPVTNHFGNISNFFFPIKGNTITLLEEDLILEENNDIVKTFTDFFTSFVSKLNISRYEDPFIESNQIANQIGHQSLRKIEQ